ncbi:Uncharacterised protein [Mycobacteroides abscessus subsp. abscessus]|nr:Uncharacterised protein [Mycobacteroides abscessus subsp. abscessus]
MAGNGSPTKVLAKRQPVSTEVENPCPHQLPANQRPSIPGTGPTTGLRSKELAVMPDQAASISTSARTGNRSVSSRRTRCWITLDRLMSREGIREGTNAGPPPNTTRLSADIR